MTMEKILALLTYDECVGKLRCVFDKGFILND